MDLMILVHHRLNLVHHVLTPSPQLRFQVHRGGTQSMGITQQLFSVFTEEWLFEIHTSPTGTPDSSAATARGRGKPQSWWTQGRPCKTFSFPSNFLKVYIMLCELMGLKVNKFRYFSLKTYCAHKRKVKAQ